MTTVDNVVVDSCVLEECDAEAWLDVKKVK
jgi:hypothetical protein